MSSNTSTKVFNLLNGMWAISRKIPGYGQMKGIANFESTLNNNELKYKENGLFIFDNGNTCEAHREYLYRLNKKNNEIEVYFIENDKNFDRLFHTLEFKNNIEENKISSLLITQQSQQFLSAKALHECSEDTYKIKYEIFKDNQFTIIYTVNGPTKNYVSETCFTKIEH
jgi:hypothetical protein